MIPTPLVSDEFLSPKELLELNVQQINYQHALGLITKLSAQDQIKLLVELYKSTRN